MQKNLTPLLVVAVALVGNDGRILLQRRREGSVHGGLWEFPGGKVEAGETPGFAALREIDEELGLRLEAGALEPVSFAAGDVEGQGGERALVILLYTCREWRGEPECRHGEEIGWFEPESIAALAMPPLDYPLARALLRHS